jgi:hypothetical protein
MTVPKCIEAYSDLSKKIFGDGKRNKVVGWAKGAWYDENTYVQALKDFLASDKYKPSLDPDALMEDPDTNACKVYAQLSTTMLIEVTNLM